MKNVKIFTTKTPIIDNLALSSRQEYNITTVEKYQNFNEKLCCKTNEMNLLIFIANLCELWLKINND